MRDPSIILVEGMPGTGKSTLSQWVHLQLRAHGRQSIWCHEESETHPVRLYYEPARHLSWPDYIEEVESRWREYAQQLRRREQIAVLDVAILQNHVRSMLIFDCNRSAILKLCLRIERQLASLDPLFIYLKPSNVEQNFRDVVEVRGQRMLDLWIAAHDHYPYTRAAGVNGYEGFIAFWEEFNEISDQVYEGLGIAKLRQDISTNNRDARLSEIRDLLSFPAPFELASSSTLERFTGEYLPRNDQTASGFLLQAQDGCLVATVDHPTIDVMQGPIGCFREVRIIPRGDNEFYVQAWPHEVQFTEDRDGKILAMQLSITEDGWPPSSEVYVKQ